MEHRTKSSSLPQDLNHAPFSDWRGPKITDHCHANIDKRGTGSDHLRDIFQLHCFVRGRARVLWGTRAFITLWIDRHDCLEDVKSWAANGCFAGRHGTSGDILGRSVNSWCKLLQLCLWPRKRFVHSWFRPLQSWLKSSALLVQRWRYIAGNRNRT